MENRDVIEKITQAKNFFLKNTNKTHEPVARLIEKKEEEAKNYKYGIKKGFTIDFRDIKKIRGSMNTLWQYLKILMKWIKHQKKFAQTGK